MLRLAPGRAADLADAIGVRTGGNPYDTVELVNALRREGALTADDTGWRWDAATIRRFVGQGDVLDLLAARIDGLPAEAASMLEVLACLGGDVGIDLLVVAADLDPTTAAEALAPALEDGLLVMIHDGAPAVRFRHDRVQQAAYARLTPMSRRALHLRLARHLAADAQLEAAAAEQYLASAQDVTDPVEGRRVAVLFQAAAADARLINPARAERLLAAALALLDGPRRRRRRPSGHATARRAARRARQPRPPRGGRRGLCRHRDAHHRCGRARGGRRRADRQPDPSSAPGRRGGPRRSSCCRGSASPRRRTRTCQQRSGAVWNCSTAGSPPAPQPGELQRPEPTDPQIVAATRLLAGAGAAAFFCRHPLLPWMAFQAHRLWVDHGPCAPSVVSLGFLPPLAIAMTQDYAVGYEATRRILAVGEARGYEPATSQMRNIAAMFCVQWFEPIEEVVRQLQQAREVLLRYGELQYAAFTYVNVVPPMLDSAPTLDVSAAEIAAALTFTAGIGDEFIAAPIRGLSATGALPARRDRPTWELRRRLVHRDGPSRPSERRSD